jgi:hypothetical protein
MVLAEVVVLYVRAQAELHLVVAQVLDMGLLIHSNLVVLDHLDMVAVAVADTEVL